MAVSSSSNRSTSGMTEITSASDMAARRGVHGHEYRHAYGHVPAPGMPPIRSGHSRPCSMRHGYMIDATDLTEDRGGLRLRAQVTLTRTPRMPRHAGAIAWLWLRSVPVAQERAAEIARHGLPWSQSG